MDAIELGPEERTAVSLFLALATQWRRHPMTGERLGLDNAAILPTAQLLGIDVAGGLGARLLPNLQVMEGAALDEWAWKR